MSGNPMNKIAEELLAKSREKMLERYLNKPIRKIPDGILGEFWKSRNNTEKISERTTYLYK